MNIDEAKRLLAEANFNVISEQRLPNNTGTQLKVDCGAIVNIFDKGTYNVQGKLIETIKSVLDAGARASSQRVPAKASSEVFVVYGHDQGARDQLEAMLRRWKLEPIFLDQLPSEGQTIIEKLESYTARVNFGVVVATPDDEGHRTGHPDEKAFRARQNVVLELGMLLALLGRKRVAILLKQQDNMERPSDIQGLIYIPFKDNMQKDAGVVLAKEMVAQGYKIDISKL
jgi:predicted nucleotide-binding protein